MSLPHLCVRELYCNSLMTYRPVSACSWWPAPFARYRNLLSPHTRGCERLLSYEQVVRKLIYPCLQSPPDDRPLTQTYHVLHQGRAEYTLIHPTSPPKIEKAVMGTDASKGEVRQLLVGTGVWKMSRIPMEDVRAAQTAEERYVLVLISLPRLSCQRRASLATALAASSQRLSSPDFTGRTTSSLLSRALKNSSAVLPMLRSTLKS
jgi:hypothetical protein